MVALWPMINPALDNQEPKIGAVEFGLIVAIAIVQVRS